MSADGEPSVLKPPTADPAALDQTLDPTTQKKRDAMISRLTNLHQSRISTTSSTDPPPPPSFESTQSFLSSFSTSKQSILSHLSLIEPNPNSNSDIQNVSVSITHLEKLLADNSYFLPSYEVRTCLKSIQDLKQSLEIVKSKVNPKKKFSFKNKPTRQADTGVSTSNLAGNDGGFSLVDGVRNTHVVDSSVVEGMGGLNSGVRVRAFDSPGFRGRGSEVLEKEFCSGDLEVMGEFSLSDLSDCVVRLKGCLRALFINRLNNCKVYVGPVFGSVLIEEAEGCVFVLASHQIRIHHAKGSDFYLRVRSRPIIEDCGGVRFAPYCLSYDGIERDLKESYLEEETGNWANVDDFRWLRAVQSPNWSVLPECERIDPVII